MSQTVATPTAGSKKSGSRPPVQKLKSERVQDELAAMGWVPDASVHTFARVIRFAAPRVAEAYAAYVSVLAAQTGQPISIEQTGKQVLVTLLNRAGNGRTGWTRAVLDFARRLAA